MQYEIELNIHNGVKIKDIYGKIKYNIFSTTPGINFITLYNSRVIYFDGYKIGIMDLQNKKINFYNLNLRMIKEEIYKHVPLPPRRIPDLSGAEVSEPNLDWIPRGRVKTYERNVELIKSGIHSKIYKCDIPSKDKPEYRVLIGKEINTPLNKDLLNIVYLYLGI